MGEDIPILKGPLNRLPIIYEIESSFQYKKAVVWYETYPYISVIASVLYLTFLYFGRRWMEKCDRFKLQRLLLAWNTGLAAFSIYGMLSLTPSLFQVLRDHGIQYSVCESNVHKSDPQLALWSTLFVFSKILELGDTVFIVLRKSPLQFLHWYHHVSVLVYTWYYLALGFTSIVHWGSVMNFIVHSIMYSYYALRAAGIKVPNKIAMVITILQITQMLTGIVLHVIAYDAMYHKRDCKVNQFCFILGFVIYSSYAVLFAMFFVNRFLSKRKLD